MMVKRLFIASAWLHSRSTGANSQGYRRAVSAQFKFPRFFVTSPAPCPYLPGRTERKVFTELSGSHAAELNEALGRIGFRRSQSVAYRPSCIDCSACVSVRVLATEFEPTATQRKLLRRH